MFLTALNRFLVGVVRVSFHSLHRVCMIFLFSSISLFHHGLERIVVFFSGTCRAVAVYMSLVRYIAELSKFSCPPCSWSCDETSLKTLDNERQQPPGKFTSRHDQKPIKPRYESRLVRSLSLINNIVQPQSIIEEIDVSANAPWEDTSFIDIQIPHGPKDIVSQKHKKKHHFTHANPEHLCFYTNR